MKTSTPKSFVGLAVQVKDDPAHRGGICERETEDGWVEIREYPDPAACAAALAARQPMPRGRVDQYQRARVMVDPT